MAWTDWLSKLGGAAGSMIAPGIGTALGAGGGALLSSLLGGKSSRSSQPTYGGYNGQMQPQQGYNTQGHNTQGYNTPMGGYRSMQMPGGSQMIQTPRFEQNQMDMISQMLSGGGAGMQNLPSADFGPIKSMYEQNFQQNTIPGIMERFSGMGAGGQRSSAFEQALGGAGAQMNTQLAGMEQMFNQQNRQSEIQRLMQMLQLGFQQPYQTDVIPPEQGFWSKLGGGLGQAAGVAAPLLGMWGMNKWGSNQTPPAGKA